VAVGQCLRYMGYVKDELAEEDQDVRGAIIGLEGDDKIRRALSSAQNIDFYTYKIDFRLEKKHWLQPNRITATDAGKKN